MSVRLSKNGKRLGRPPKNAVKSDPFAVVPVPAVVPSFAVVAEQVKEAVLAVEGQSELLNLDFVECTLLEIPANSYDPTPDLKSGKYMHNLYNIEWFGTKKWVVGAYINADFEKYKNAKCDMSLVLKGCVNYLNTIKSKKSNKYGNLELHSKRVNFVNKSGINVAVVELVIDERKNPNFWGEGEKIKNGE